MTIITHEKIKIATNHLAAFIANLLKELKETNVGYIIIYSYYEKSGTSRSSTHRSESSG